MSLEEIKNELKQIDDSILTYSVDKNLADKEELVKVYKRLKRCKEQFLQLKFLEQDLDELEYVRFCIIENIFLLRIMIRENMGTDVNSNLTLLRTFYKENQKGEMYNE